MAVTLGKPGRAYLKNFVRIFVYLTNTINAAFGPELHKVKMVLRELVAGMVWGPGLDKSDHLLIRHLRRFLMSLRSP